MKSKYITIVNAREHNLKGIDLKIPRNSITVITGISGSGKSSLAFDTIYAEGNRRYVESLSSYAKQFIDVLKKPEVESIEGLSPSIAINQKNVSKSPRSTVGTSTDIYDYLRLLYSKIGTPYCYSCGKVIISKSVDSLIEDYSKIEVGKKLYILSPIIRGKKGEHRAVFTKLRNEGFSSVIVDDKTIDLDDNINLEKNKIHSIDVVVDKIITDDKTRTRLSNSINLAIRLSEGFIKIILDKNPAITISQKHYCVDCGISYQDIEPRTFSFNSPYGACSDCDGIGEKEVDGEKVICDTCKGSRLRKEALSIKINNLSIYDISSMDMYRLKKSLLNIDLSGNEKMIADKIIKEIIERVDFIINVGLGYISLNRTMSSLSGGEAQRIRLATQLGTGLTGVLYVLDEPSIGLHPNDNKKLINTLFRLRDKKNTVIVVEHDEETIRSADHIIDLGPGAGIHGGVVIAQGDINAIIANKKSLTGQYLSNNMRINIPKRKRSSGKYITIKDVNTHNLKNVTASFPLGLITCVTGVSGSGKSSLIADTLVPIIHKLFEKGKISKTQKIKNQPSLNSDWFKYIDRIVNIDQSAIGRTPRSNPATYTGIFPLIRSLFTSLPDSRARAYTPGRFSFNVPGGRCETCEGQGMIRIEMKFMPDVFVLCDVCNGSRFNRETLEIRYKNKNIAQILDMTIEEAMSFFKNIRMIYNKIRTMNDVGLGYIKLGQSATTLSGGEAQRIKLSKELGKKSSGKTLYILDEPTTGLHFDDIKKLINLLHMLRDEGNTIIVIEHNLDVIKSSDHVIDLGPGGGEAGGFVIAKGSPEDIVHNTDSKTGLFLKEKLREVL